MRIAFIGQKGFPATWGGVEVHVEAIATRLAKRGHLVTVYSRRWYSREKEQRLRGVVRVSLPTVHTRHLDASAHSFISAVHAAVRARADIVHFHGIGPALFSMLPRPAVRAVVTTVHARDYLRDKWGPVARLALRAGEQLAVRTSDRVVVVSRELERYYRERGIDVTYIPNGVNAPERVDAERIRTELGLEAERFLLSMGRWVPEKRVRELVAAFAASPPAGLSLVVAGAADDPDYERAVRAAAAGSPRIVFPGMVSGRLKAELLRHARGFIAASALEGLPITLLEAMAAGQRCVASDIAPHRELVGAVGGELLFPVDDPARGIALLAGEGPEGAGRRARSVASKYTWSACVNQLEQVYAEVLS